MIQNQSLISSEKQSGNLRGIMHIRVSTAERTLHWRGVLSYQPVRPFCLWWLGQVNSPFLRRERWMYRCTQLVLRNNVITPVHSHVMLAPPANYETKIPSPLPPFSFHSLSAHRRVETQYHSSARHAVATEAARRTLFWVHAQYCLESAHCVGKHFLHTHTHRCSRVRCSAAPPEQLQAEYFHLKCQHTSLRCLIFNFRSNRLPRCSYSSLALFDLR